MKNGRFEWVKITVFNHSKQIFLMIKIFPCVVKKGYIVSQLTLCPTPVFRPFLQAQEQYDYLRKTN